MAPEKNEIKSLQEQLEEYKKNPPVWTDDQLKAASVQHMRLQEKYNFKGDGGGTVPEEYRQKLMDVPKYENFDLDTRKRIFWNVARQMEPGYQVPEKLHDTYRGLITDIFDENGVLLIGGVGTGKTLLMRIFQRAVQAEGKKIRICSVPEMEQHMRTAKDPDYTLWDRGLICFDDLGSENESVIYGNRTMVMTEIIYRRYNRFQTEGVVTHATTNLLPQQIEEKYGTRAWDRIQEMMKIYVITGSSYRKLNDR